MNSEFWLSVFGGLVGIIVTCLLLAHTMKCDKQLAKIIKSMNLYHLCGFFIAIIPTAIWIFLIGLADNLNIWKAIDVKSLLGEILTSLLIFSIPAIFSVSWGLSYHFLKKLKSPCKVK